MNTDKTLREKFCRMNEYPIWYYKELSPVEVDYVVWNLLKEPFVVEIDGCKYEITFGKNRKHEIGQCISYKDIKKSTLSSYQVVNRGFREGKWYTISETDTTEEFKANYVKQKEEHDRQELEKFYREILIGIVEGNKKIPKEKQSSLVEEINNYTFEDLEYTIKGMFDKYKKTDDIK